MKFILGLGTFILIGGFILYVFYTFYRSGKHPNYVCKNCGCEFNIYGHRLFSTGLGKKCVKCGSQKIVQKKFVDETNPE